MRYNYACTGGCTIEKLEIAENADKMASKTVMDTQSHTLVWEEKHGMKEDPKIICPICGSVAKKTFEGMPFPLAWVKGYGYLDRLGCRRDMDLFKLNKGEDPYPTMRQPGEIEQLKDNLVKKGKRQKNRKYYS